ncbi:hypothetical protein RMN57_05840 [Kitasatospora sp. CM 4170]|uniref:SPOR domain-containing protein n=1 Tax=Kitasatospora aburaviensis TaxID=67265 RepID=A0ABW1EWT5_9ACTN|nr:hypothetical protein [Kitasatospora sp. CM 4170]WNM44267.1 hypothetical protein RMN57_05840 [Kitasatospora sp. CM 4170]
MTTQGERTPSSGDPSSGDHGLDHLPSGTYRRPRRSIARRAVGWVVVVGVVAAGGWIITRPTPGDFIPGLGPSSKDASKTPPVVGTPAPRTVADPEGLDVDTLFPAQRLVEAGGYKGKRSGVRQGENCTEALQDRTQDVLRETGCQGYLTVSFAGQEKPVLSSVTVLRFADQAGAAKAADALRAKPGALAFILPDATTARPPAAGAAQRGTEGRVEAVGRHVTVTSSRLPEAHTPAPSASGTGTGSATPLTVPPSPAASPEQILDEATRAVSYAAGSPFAWM